MTGLISRAANVAGSIGRVWRRVTSRSALAKVGASVGLVLDSRNAAVVVVIANL